MAEQRPLVLLNGHLQQLPVGDDLTQHKALIITAAGEVRQLSDAEDIVSFQPLVLIGSEIQELPVGDTLAGVNIIVDMTIHDLTSAITHGPRTGSVVVMNTDVAIIHGPPATKIALNAVQGNVIHGPAFSKLTVTDLSSAIIHGPTNSNIVMQDLTAAIILES